MIDLHCHILPGVDDGSDSLQSSLDMAEQAVSSGVRVICATPHFGPANGSEARSEILEAFRLLRSALAKEQIPLKIALGMELFSGEGVTELNKQNLLLPINSSRFLMTEFDFGISSEQAEVYLALHESNGYIPVVAHPERYSFVQRDPLVLLDWIRQGRVIQLNNGSFFGMFGARAKDAAMIAMREGWVHLIASDAHSPHRRTTSFVEISRFLEEATFPELADLVLRKNPERILLGKSPVSVAEEFPLNGDKT